MKRVVVAVVVMMLMLKVTKVEPQSVGGKQGPEAVLPVSPLSASCSILRSV